VLPCRTSPLLAHHSLPLGASKVENAIERHHTLETMSCNQFSIATGAVLMPASEAFAHMVLSSTIATARKRQPLARVAA
jgi:hypothetical protein